MFPQCCTDLGDWAYWRSIVKDNTSVYYNGHPAPIVEFDLNHVIFICKDDYEKFVPPTDERIVVELKVLEVAYENMTAELKAFAQRITDLSSKFSFQTINHTIENILIFRNLELEITSLEE